MLSGLGQTIMGNPDLSKRKLKHKESALAQYDIIFIGLINIKRRRVLEPRHISVAMTVAIVSITSLDVHAV